MLPLEGSIQNFGKPIAKIYTRVFDEKMANRTTGLVKPFARVRIIVMRLGSSRWIKVTALWELPASKRSYREVYQRAKIVPVGDLS